MNVEPSHTRLTDGPMLDDRSLQQYVPNGAYINGALAGSSA